MASFLEHPESYVVLPTAEHKQTLIALHGRGSNGRDFGTALLAATLPDNTVFWDAFPNAKFIFPTAAFRRSTMFKRKRITQWFDMAELEDLSKRSELQIEGLVETAAFLHALLLSEIKLVGPSNIALGGLSQGCAGALVALLLWPGPPVPAFFGLRGWLPFQEVLALAQAPEIDDETNFFSGSSEYEGAPSADRAIMELKDMLGWNQAEASTNITTTAVFMGHGAEDPKILVKNGEDAAKVLSSLGIPIEWHKYNGLGHWYSAEEFADLVEFLRKRLS